MSRWSLLALMLVLTGCSKNSTMPIVGTLERRRIEVAATANEQIAAMHVREGDRVAAGQLLAEMDTSSLQAARDATAAELQGSRERLAELRNGARPEELTEARARVAAALADQEQARKEYQRQSELATRGLSSQSQLDLQRRAHDSADAAVQGARATLRLLEKGTRVEQLGQGQAAVASAEAQLQQQQVMLGRLRLTAPVAGTVEALPYRQGERPPLGAPVVVLLAGGTPFARVYVPEPLRARVVAGARVTVHVDGIAQPLQGVVRYLAGEASFTPYFALTQRDRSRLAYVAEIDLPEPRAAELPVGVPLEVTLESAP